MNGMKPFSEGRGGGMRKGEVYFSFSYLGVFPSFKLRLLSFLPSFLPWFLSPSLSPLLSVFLCNPPTPFQSPSLY